MIEIKNVDKIYVSKGEEFQALTDINLTVEKGDIYGVIGLSGAGKSTLVRCINLIEKPTSGQILIDGADITAMGERELRETRQKLGMIFQEFNLLMQRSVIDNIKFPLEIAGVGKGEALEKSRELLKLVGLEGKADSYPAKLSGGQKQRVAIARALANDPKVLLCDEATSALDPMTTDSILALLKDINEKLGVTIIIITHEMKVIETICNKVAVIENSKIIKTGWTKDMINHFEEA
ncbi:MAG TPA: hypothetical protein DHN33_04890 [Eubacteriaceae bacterium]|nr:hypothetical protein [Eubacteriaceae bacterium]